MHARMPSFRQRLKPDQRREYDRSNRVSAIPLRVSARLRRAVELLEPSLARGDRERVRFLARVICDEICGALRVPSADVIVEGVRRSNRTGELHGLFTSGPRQGARIQVWMFTAKRRQVVAFKTFLRTLLHEICHHLDYALLRLRESLHTDGFFQRESSLVRQVLHAPREPLRPNAETSASDFAPRADADASRAEMLVRDSGAKVRNLS
jgi:hypothetical protein